MSPTVNRILHIAGIVATTAIAVIVPIVANLPAGSTWAIRLGALAGILSTLQKAFGTTTQNAAITDIKSKVPFIILAFLAFGGTSCAWWQKHEPQIDCALLATVTDAPQLVAIVEGCTAIVVDPSAIPACVSAAANSKWTSDILGCFEQAATGKATCPAYKSAKAQIKAAAGK